MPLESAYLPADTFGLTEIARRALSERPHPRGFDGLSIPASIADIPLPEDRWDAEVRLELADSLQAGIAPFRPHVHVVEAIRQVAEPGTTIVLAGQQPGFLGGPLLDLHKAAHAVRLARELTKAWGRPVVAGFWNHSDDHDLAEVHHLWIQNPELDLRKIGLSGAASTRTPLSEFRFKEEHQHLGAIRELLRQNLWKGGERADAIERFLPRDGETFGAAFGRTLLDLFGSAGLIVFEPHMLRAQLSRGLAGALGTSWRAPLIDRANQLLEHGLEVPIQPANAALVFQVRDDPVRNDSDAPEKHALRFALNGESEELAFDDESGSRTQAELAAEVLAEPERFIAGALLRPVLQDAILPTAAYVGGWGELAYHVQLTGLRRALGTPTPPFVPRVSATIVTPEVRHALTRLEASPLEVLRAAGKFGADEAPSAGPPVTDTLRSIAERAAAEILDTRDEIRALDPGLAAQAKKTAGQVRNTIEKLTSKLTRVHAAKSGRSQRHLRRVNHGLVPRGEPQERVRGALEFVARCGDEWVAEWTNQIDPLPTEHVVLDLIESPEAAEPSESPASPPERSDE